ncbi:hypothetical protein DFS34DRAFT_483698 [Phlyctochytrium arcticum]|nr:hypothetical protein DFS34DRAFT_483698 [Phlyctochytrium arcticum]
MTSRNSDLQDYVKDQLSVLMGLGGSELDQVATYLLGLDLPRVPEFLTGMLGEGPEAMAFMEEYVARRFPKFETRGAWTAPLKTPVKEELKGYRKSEAEEESRRNPPPPPASRDGHMLSERLGDPPTPTTSKKEKQGKKRMNLDQATARMDSLDNLKVYGNHPPGVGGRVFCECMAVQHGLLTNCLGCGKIICKIEGEGPCPQCGTPISIPDGHQRTLSAPRQKSSPKPLKKDAYTGARYGKAAGAQIPSLSQRITKPADKDPTQFPELLTEKEMLALEKAEAQKARLLEFQSQGSARTRVYDEASDFDFVQASTNKWLSAEERALALRKSREQEQQEVEARRRRVITIDLSGKKVVEVQQKQQKENVDAYLKQKSGRSIESDEGVDRKGVLAEITPGSTGLFRNPTLRIPAPVYIPSSARDDDSHNTNPSDEPPEKIPVQRRKKMEASTPPTTAKSPIKTTTTLKPSLKWQSSRSGRGFSSIHALDSGDYDELVNDTFNEEEDEDAPIVMASTTGGEWDDEPACG